MEDNRDLREIIGTILEHEMREIVACEDAEEALVHAQQAPFGLVITDITLPGISGVEFARILLAANPSQWVVLCSGYTIDDEWLAMGPNVRALLKPFDIDELDRLLAEIAETLR